MKSKIIDLKKAPVTQRFANYCIDEAFDSLVKIKKYGEAGERLEFARDIVPQRSDEIDLKLAKLKVLKSE